VVAEQDASEGVFCPCIRALDRSGGECSDLDEIVGEDPGSAPDLGAVSAILQGCCGPNPTRLRDRGRRTERVHQSFLHLIFRQARQLQLFSQARASVVLPDASHPQTKTKHARAEGVRWSGVAGRRGRRR